MGVDIPQHYIMYFYALGRNFLFDQTHNSFVNNSLTKQPPFVDKTTKIKL